MADNVLPVLPKALRSQEEDITRRKKTQAKISTASAGLGLAGLGTMLASTAIRRKPTAFKIKPEKAENLAHKLKESGVYQGVGATGVGSGSSLYFAGTQRRESSLSEAQRQHQSRQKIRKALYEIAKAKQRESVAVQRGTPAWRMATPFDRKSTWRDEVSPGARMAYDYPLAESRKKRNRRYAGSAALDVGALGAAGYGLHAMRGSPLKVPKRSVAAVAAAPAMLGGSAYLWHKGNKYDEASRKIRARGYQRQLEEQPVEKKFGTGTMFRTPKGGMSYRRGALTPVAKNPFRRMQPNV